MPIYYGSTKIDRISFGGTEIDKVYRGDVLVFQHGPKYIFPVIYKEPLESEEVVLDSVSGRNYKIGIIPEDGWYRIATRAESGHGGYPGGASGGCVSDAIVFLYKDSKYIIWGASGRFTGYIQPSGKQTSNVWNGGAEDGVLGGSGGTGGNSGESGSGGGGAGGHGAYYNPESGYGGGGTGCIVGLEHNGQTLTEEWSHGGFEVKSVECMVLAGGGGSGTGDNGEPRTGGAGGGAWGNGGVSAYRYAYGRGPGGETFGKGESNSGWGWWAGPARGAWCVRDYTNPRFDCGVGVKSGSSCNIGSTFIYKINRLSFILTLKTKPNKVNYMFVAGTPYNLGDKSIEVLKNRYAAYYVSKAGYTPIIDGRFVPHDMTENVKLEETTFDYSLDLRYTNEEVEDYYDYGLLSEEPTFGTNLQGIMPTVIEETIDCRNLISCEADEFEDWNIDEGDEDWNADEGDEDWGSIWHSEPITRFINCGNITDETSDTINTGTIY